MADKIYINRGKIDTAEIMKIIKLTDFQNATAKNETSILKFNIYKNKPLCKDAEGQLFTCTC